MFTLAHELLFTISQINVFFSHNVLVQSRDLNINPLFHASFSFPSVLHQKIL